MFLTLITIIIESVASLVKNIYQKYKSIYYSSGLHYLFPLELISPVKLGII